MFRRPNLIVALACFVLLALAGTAFAGGVVVTLDQMPAGAQPGKPVEVGFMILSAHTGDAVSGERPIVVATNPQTNEAIRAVARPSGPTGHYVVTLTLPTEGRWSWRIHPFSEAADYPASEFTPIEVRAAPVAAPALAQADAARQAGPFELLSVSPVLAGLIVLALVAVSIALRGRLRPARA
jgi:hypothetical protein